MNSIGAIFNYRPFTFIGLITALHTLVYGIGYLVPTSGFNATILYGSISTLVDPFYVGILLTVAGVYSTYVWVTDNPRHIAISSSILAFFWLFAAMSYFVVGAVGLGIGVGLVWSLLSGYLAFAYKNKDDIAIRFINQYFIDILDGKEEP